MKTSKPTRKVRAAAVKIADHGKVRLGSYSPTFTISTPRKKVADAGKVRLGSYTPAF